MRRRTGIKANKVFSNFDQDDVGWRIGWWVEVGGDGMRTRTIRIELNWTWTDEIGGAK